MGAEQQITINEYERRLIRLKAWQLVGKYGFTRSDREDIEQDLALHVIEHMGQFDPKRSSRSTFVDRIVNRRIISILRQRFAQRRDYRRCVALDEAIVNREDAPLKPEDQRRVRVDPTSDLAIDLHDAIESLEADTQHMCRLLMHEASAETARRLGLTPAEARTRVARIRRQLTDAGLEVYLKA